MAAGAQLPSRHAAFPFVALALCDPGPGPSPLQLHFNYRYTSSSPELSPQRSANRGKARVQPPPKAAAAIMGVPRAGASSLPRQSTTAPLANRVAITRR